MSVVDRDGDFNFPILMFGVTALAGWGVISPTSSSSPVGVAILIGVAAAYLVGGVFILREQSREDDLRRWLFTSAQQIWDTGATRDGITVRPGTALVTYPIGVSMLVLRFHRAGCPRFAEAPDAHAGKLGALFTTALTGWWSIFGILRTPFEIGTTLSGGERITVQAYMEHLQAIGVTSRWQQRGEVH